MGMLSFNAVVGLCDKWMGPERTAATGARILPILAGPKFHRETNSRRSPVS